MPPSRLSAALNAFACASCWSFVVMANAFTVGIAVLPPMKSNVSARSYVATARFSSDAAVCRICTSEPPTANAGESNSASRAAPKPRAANAPVPQRRDRTRRLRSVVN